MPTVSEYLLQGAGRLSFGPHSDRARADAELLLMNLLGINRAWLVANAHAEIGFEHWEPYDALLERRYGGEPIQYITGECEFYGLPFKVTRDVLIPRPETEHLVEKVIEAAQGFTRPHIVDVGTGSGAIAVALAHHLVNADLTAIDLSGPALAVAGENARRNGVEDRIRFLEGDLLGPVAGERFDFVVSNPPYVPHTDRALIAVEVREYEPAVALFGGEDGLDVYRRLIPAAFAVLVPGGWFAAEMGFSQGPDIEGLFRSAGFAKVELAADLQGIPRVVSARRPE